MKPVYYNEWDRFAAQWLRNLIAAGHLPAGEVDERSIVDVRPDDLAGFGQCHFFAGIGGWALACKLAGWGDRPVWTASLPCQPWSAIGKRNGVNDDRDLWPCFRNLVEECSPSRIFGEQVASQDGIEWLDRVRVGLEDLGYAVGAANLCAAGISAPHIRQRIFWMGDANYTGLERHAGNGDSGWQEEASGPDATTGRAVPWNACDIITDRNGQSRRCESGVSPMAPRLPNHMGLLRAYGNAIVPQLGAEFIRASMEVTA